ncbi:MAG: tetratricopeptide repeat protein [Salibacter sp.]|uniref:tetratricopeptide repeat protein n=1 Tax=Salibacter sp. TaxID=2010995 RepID=UPI002870032B|nr:tetratricopeptide repeat protein [Salibacter sp.]MDR9398081.1 tetratricopeptide repeat protein [Salibacter sp.]
MKIRFCFIFMSLVVSSLSFGQNSDSTLFKEIDQRLYDIWDYMSSHPDSFDTEVNKIMKDAKAIDYHSGVSQGWRYKAVKMLYAGELDSALHLADRALEIQVRHDDKSNAALTYNLMGIIYKKKTDYGKAISCFMNALKINQELDYLSSAGANYSNLCEIYRIQGKYEKAVETAKKGLLLNITDKDTFGICSSYNNLALSYQKLGKYDTAAEYLMKSLELERRLNRSNGVVQSYINIGNLYAEKGDYDLGLYYTKKALNQFDSVMDVESKAVGLLNLFDLYHHKGELDSAFKYGSNGLELTREIDYPDLEYDYLKIFTKYYSSKGNYKKALEHYRRSVQLRDSLDLVNDGVKIAEIQERTEAEIKKQALEEKQKSNFKFGFWIYSISFVFFLIINIITFKFKKNFLPLLIKKVTWFLTIFSFSGIIYHLVQYYFNTGLESNINFFLQLVIVTLTSVLFYTFAVRKSENK